MAYTTIAIVYIRVYVVKMNSSYQFIISSQVYMVYDCVPCLFCTIVLVALMRVAVKYLCSYMNILIFQENENKKVVKWLKKVVKCGEASE